MLLTRNYRNGFDNPFNLMNDMRRELDRLFSEEAFGLGAPSTRSLKSTFVENDDAFVLRLEVPGLSADALTLSVADGHLRLAGERNEEAPEGFKARRTERVRYRFDRRIALPKLVDAEKVEAALKDGLLTVTLPKAAKPEPRVIDVKAS